MSRFWHSQAPLALLCLLFFSLSLAGLGAWQFPRSGWLPPRGAEVVVDLGREERVERGFFLALDQGEVNLQAYCGSPGEWEKAIPLQGKGEWKQWLKLPLNCTARYLRLEFGAVGAPLGEMAFTSGDRRLGIARLLPQGQAPGAAALADEQGLVGRLPRSQMESYFDEVYFARSAEQYLRGELPFEWTHPPLGKLLRSASLLAFGSTPLGWRFPGVLSATLALPLVYLIARDLLRSHRAGLVASFLVAFDFMHFTMSRLATGETFLFTFLLLMFYFFLRYWRSGRARYLFLSLLGFGLALSVKWVAANGLVGLVLLLGWRWRRGAKRGELAALAGGALAAAFIYFLSYLPDLLAGRTALGIWKLQFSMFGYHAGLREGHPSGSPWWSWPLLLQPIWLYYGEGTTFRSLIVAWGNPVLWWGGLVALAWLGWRWARWREAAAPLLLVPFLSQWLLFIPVPRVLFLYHYYPNVLFLALTLAAVLERLDRKWRVACLIAVPALFLFFYPFISGLPLPLGYWQRLDLLVKWLTS